MKLWMLDISKFRLLIWDSAKTDYKDKKNLSRVFHGAANTIISEYELVPSDSRSLL